MCPKRSPRHFFEGLSGVPGAPNPPSFADKPRTLRAPTIPAVFDMLCGCPFFTPQIPGRFQNVVYSTDYSWWALWTHRTDSALKVYGGQTAKNIYLGETRIVTKLNAGSNPTVQEESDKQYFYHSDHLGSASLISDCDGNEYQRIEYTPYGEIWVEKTENNGLAYLPYKFTGKEMDEARSVACVPPWEVCLIPSMAICRSQWKSSHFSDSFIKIV